MTQPVASPASLPSASRALLRKWQRGQQMVEYSVVTIGLLGGFAALSWPFLVQLINALGTFFASIYYVLGLPLG